MKRTHTAFLATAIMLVSMASIADAQQHRAPVRIVESRPYLAPVTTGPFVVTPPRAPEDLAWEDHREIGSEWTEIKLTAAQSGRHIFLGVSDNGALIRLAEIVFDNGDSYEIDCNDQTVQPGWYSLIDIADGRKVDRIRIVARASGQSADLILRLTS